MATDTNTYWTRDRIMHLIIGVALAVFIIMLIHYLSDVLLPFFVACFIAYLLQPMVDFNCRLLHLRGRAIPSVVSLLEIFLVIGLVVYLFLPSVLSELQDLGKILDDISSGRVETPPIYRGALEFINTYLNPRDMREYLSADHLTAIINGGSSIIEKSLDLVLAMLSWLLTIIYLLFILIDYPRISRGFKMIVPAKYRSQLMPVFDDAAQSMNHFFRGQGKVALCAMVFYCTGFSIVGLPLAIPMGLLVGVLYMIPYFQYVTVIPVTAIAFIYSLGGEVAFFPMLGKCALVYVVSQCVCDYVITPHVMGKELGLNPAIILLSLSVWGSLLGIIGMIIALPVTSLIMTYYYRYISNPNPGADTP